MKYLKQYVDRKNQWGAIFKQKQLVIGQDNQAIADSLDCDMSPENICADGERAASEVRKLRILYTNAARELLALDPNVRIYEMN